MLLPRFRSAGRRTWIALMPMLISSLGAQSLSFQQSKISAGCNPAKVTSGDFNGDRFVDLAITCTAASQSPIAILLGKGDGTFQSPIPVSAPALATALGNRLVAADFNTDGKTDLGYVASSGSIVVLLSGGDGTFRQVTTTATDTKLAMRKAADMNGDGRPDAVLLSGSNNSLAVIALGKGDGGFGAPTPISISVAARELTGFAASDVIVGDFDRNGVPDLVVFGLPTWSAFVAPILVNVLGQRSGSYSSNYFFYETGAIAAGDFNGDGTLDFCAATFFEGGTGYTDMFRGDGQGSYLPVQSIFTFDGPAAAGDLNGDGKDELLAASSSFSGLRVVTFDQRGAEANPQLHASGTVDLGAFPTDLIVVDLDGDGKLDVVTANSSNVSILINTTPISRVSAALNGASFATSQAVAPGSLISVFGVGLASSDAQASAIPLPSSLGGVSVAIGGVPAPLMFVSSKQINVQVPWSVPAGPADIVVTANGTALAAFHATIGAAAPGIFSTQFGVGQAIAINGDGTLAGPEGSIPGIGTHPTRTGDTIIVLGTGLGAVSPSITTGAASLDTLRNTAIKPVVLIGGAPATVSFSGLSPQFVGVNQLNVVVPNIAAGTVPLQIESGGVRTTDKVTIAVGNP
jgi:uncharacterized protein (TIGR03437 family)